MTAPEALVAALLADGVGALGAQVHVATPAGEREAAAGMSSAGDAMAVDHLHPGYCATRPLLLLALAGAAGDLRPACVGDAGAQLDPDWGVDPATPVLAVGAHAVGWSHPTAAVWRMTPAEERSALLRGAADRPRRPAYSEVLAGLVLEVLLEALTGRRAADVVTDDVLGPLGLTDDVIVCGDRLQRAANRVRVPVGGLPVDPVPLLSEQLPSQLAEARPALGGYATARGLGRLLGAVGRALGGESVPGLPSSPTLRSCVAAGRGVVRDEVLRRDADFAGGWCRGLEGHGFGAGWSDASVGTMAGVISLGAATDPDDGTTVAWCLNGAEVGGYDDILVSRRAVVGQLRRLADEMGGQP